MNWPFRLDVPEQTVRAARSHGGVFRHDGGLIQTLCAIKTRRGAEEYDGVPALMDCFCVH